MKNKYTVIYTERWQSGSHHHALTKMKRVEVDFDEGSLMDQLVKSVGTEDIQFIFVGWPMLEGERNVPELSYFILPMKEC